MEICKESWRLYERVDYVEIYFSKTKYIFKDIFRG